MLKEFMPRDSRRSEPGWISSVCRCRRKVHLDFAVCLLIGSQLRSVVEQYGRDQGFALILDATTVAWASAAIDVTVPIVDQYNRLYPVTSGAAAPGGSN